MEYLAQLSNLDESLYRSGLHLKRSGRFLRVYLLLFFLLTGCKIAFPQLSGSSWKQVSLPFRPLAVAVSPSSLWVCGSSESIASSTDGVSWQTRNTGGTGSALLLGIDFRSERFGYAFGTAGTLVTTEDGGTTWVSKKVATENILAASLADPSHGLLRTASSVLLLNGDAPPKAIQILKSVPASFRDAPAVVALSAMNMMVELSEGPYSESGLLSTTDGGNTWSFYDPPSTGIADVLEDGGKYWVIGHEVVHKDQPGGGYAVPLAMSSSDGRTWQHTANDIHACHWQGCGNCNAQGCLASSSLIVNPFGVATTFASLPKGQLTTKWAGLSNVVCSVNGSLYCVLAGTPPDPLAQGEPAPKHQELPALGPKPTPTGILRCIFCSLEPVFVDDKKEGVFAVKVAFTVRSDGTPEGVVVSNAPSESLEGLIKAQLLAWLYEPPVKDGKPARVNTGGEIHIRVIRSK